MNKERDLLPWILGALSVATIAVAFAAVSTHREAATVARTPLAASAPAVLTPVSAPELPTPATAQSSPPTPILDSAPSGAPEVQAGQIWECTTNGVKTFSNNPCGEKSTRLEVSPINTMSATPATRFARAYGSEQRYAPAYADQGAGGDDQQYSQDNGAEAGGNSYTIIQAGLIAHRRPEHSHRPPPHHNSGHASGPSPR